MGSRADDKLKEIDELRSSLGRKLDEIERRFPIAGMGKKVGAALAGSSVAGTALAFGLRRMRGGRKAKKRKSKGGEPMVAPAAVTVNVFPKGAAWLAAAGLAGWAGYKIYDAVTGSKQPGDKGFRPSVVTIPEPGRESGRSVGN